MNKILTEREVNQYSPLALAFLGDSIYEQLVREKIIFAANVKFPAVIGNTSATTTAKPVTPPNVKLLGNLKKYTPTAIINMLIVIITKLLICFTKLL